NAGMPLPSCPTGRRRSAGGASAQASGASPRCGPWADVPVRTYVRQTPFVKRLSTLSRLSAMTAPDRATHPSTERVSNALREGGATGEVRALTESTRTAQEAAAALGVPVGAIVKSLVFTA